jgi:hypothetical protein
MDRPLDPLHSWHLVDAPPGTPSAGAAVESALGRGQATLTYGERCFEFLYAVETGGACFVRLQEIGHLTWAGSGAPILVFTPEGRRVERRVVPCRDGLDAQVLPNVDPEALQALGLALLDEAARGLDEEERSP